MVVPRISSIICQQLFMELKRYFLGTKYSAVSVLLLYMFSERFSSQKFKNPET